MRFWICLVALACVACIGARPLGGPVGIPQPDRTASPVSDPTLPEESIGSDQLGTFFGPSTVVPTPAAADYRDDVDVRELYRDLVAYADRPLRYRGTVWTVIEQDQLLFVQVRVPYGSGPDEWRAIVVLFPLYRVAVDTTLLREGTAVVVWGRPRTMLHFTDENGNEVTQPLLLGDRIDRAE